MAEELTHEQYQVRIAELTAEMQKNHDEYEANLVATTGKTSQDFVDEHLAKVTAEHEESTQRWEKMYGKTAPWRTK
jgi:hypothetical protein